MNTAQHRAAFRLALLRNGATPTFHKEQYRIFIETHLLTLKKYLLNFKKFYRAKRGRTWKGPVTVRRVFNIMAKDPKQTAREFMHYFLWKTHFSYEVGESPVPMKLPKRLRRMSWRTYGNKVEKSLRDPKNVRAKNAEKMSEFVVLILAEYVILHNYMWSSGMKPWEVNSIDKWLENIDEQGGVK